MKPTCLEATGLHGGRRCFARRWEQAALKAKADAKPNGGVEVMGYGGYGSKTTKGTFLGMISTLLDAPNDIHDGIVLSRFTHPAFSEHVPWTGEVPYSR